MKQKQHNIKQDILFVLGSSFVVVVAWIGFNIYHIWVTSTIEETVQRQLTPIEGSFNTQIIQKIKARKQIEPVFTKEGTASVSAEVSPTEQPSPTPNLNNSSTPAASQSGQLNTEEPLPSL